MPAASAAWMIIEPFGARKGLPSISISTRSGAVLSFGCALIVHSHQRQELLPAKDAKKKRKSFASPRILCVLCGQKDSLLLSFADEKSCGHSQLLIHHRATVLHVVLELVPVVAQEALHRPRRGFAEGADGVPFDLSGNRFQT